MQHKQRILFLSIPFVTYSFALIILKIIYYYRDLLAEAEAAEQ